MKIRKKQFVELVKRWLKGGCHAGNELRKRNHWRVDEGKGDLKEMAEKTQN